MLRVYQFFRLIRLPNILVIVLTMCVFYGFFTRYHLERQYQFTGTDGFVENDMPSVWEQIGLYDFHFLLLIVSVVFIAASGNIINDYFDVKADRVNKPNRLIIDRYIKRRWAIILNWTFNGTGLLIALYLSWQLHNWWILFVSFLSINLLYFYSAIYKRKLLSGNIIVAFLTAIVPLYVFIYAGFSDFNTLPHFGLNDAVFIRDNFFVTLFYCGFAFFLNLIREIIKDMADVKGDLLLQSTTFPIRFGFMRTKYLLSVLYAIVLIPLSYYLILVFATDTAVTDVATDLLYFSYSLILVVIFVLISYFILVTKSLPRYYLMASNTIKVAMLFGIISALFYA